MSAVAILVKKQPGILMVDVEKTLMPKAEYIRDDLFEGNDDAAQQLILRCPWILTLSLNGRLIARADALRQSGFDPSQYIPTWSGLTNKKFETWFNKKTGDSLPEGCLPTSDHETDGWCTSYEERIMRIGKCFSSELDMDLNDFVRLVERHPPLKQHDIDRLKEKISYYLHLMNGSKEDVRSMILSYPNVLSLSLETNIKPKVEFLKQEVFPGQNDETNVAIRETIKKSPIYLTSACESKIVPRVHAVKAAGIDISQLKLGYLMKFSKKDFPAWIEGKNANKPFNNDMRWQNKFEDLIEYRKMNGHINLKRKENKSLYDWIMNQRQLFNKNKLDPDRIAKLESINFAWSGRNRKN